MIGRVALRACRNHKERLAMLWLCEEADRLKWEKPVAASLTDISAASGMARSNVRAWLGRMEELGVISVSDEGGPKRARRITVETPCRTALSHRDNVVVAGVVEDSETPTDTTYNDRSIRGKTLDPRQKTQDNSASALSAQPDGRASMLADCWTAWRVHHPRAAKKPSAPFRARVKSHGPEAVKQVIEWAHESGHDRAVYLRANGHLKPTTVFRPDNFVAYLEMSEQVTGSSAKPAMSRGMEIVSLLLQNPKATRAQRIETFGDEWNEIYRVMKTHNVSSVQWADAGHDISRGNVRRQMETAFQGYGR